MLHAGEIRVISDPCSIQQQHLGGLICRTFNYLVDQSNMFYAPCAAQGGKYKNYYQTECATAPQHVKLRAVTNEAKYIAKIQANGVITNIGKTLVIIMLQARRYHVPRKLREAKKQNYRARKFYAGVWHHEGL